MTIFTRRPVFKEGDDGELHQVYYRHGAWVPMLGRLFRPHTSDLAAAYDGNGDLIFYERKSYNERITSEVWSAMHRRTDIIGLSIKISVLIILIAFSAFGLHWMPSTSREWSTLIHGYRLPWMGPIPNWGAVVGSIIVVVLILATIRLTFYLLGQIITELLYQAKFAFMEGAKTERLPAIDAKVEPREERYNAGTDPFAADRMAPPDDGCTMPRPRHGPTYRGGLS